jgi:hypothetical protein
MKKRRKPELHTPRCKTCARPDCAEIDRAVIEWHSVSQVARQFRISRQALTRHIAGKELIAARQRNVKPVFMRVIEKGLARLGKVSVRDVIAAASAVAKLDQDGHWIDRSQVTVEHYLPKMTADELKDLAEQKVIPEWVKKEIETIKARIEASEAN